MYAQRATCPCFLANFRLLPRSRRHRQYCSGERKERALEMSRASLLDLLHAQAAIADLA